MTEKHMKKKRPIGVTHAIALRPYTTPPSESVLNAMSKDELVSELMNLFGYVDNRINLTILDLVELDNAAYERGFRAGYEQRILDEDSAEAHRRNSKR